MVNSILAAISTQLHANFGDTYKYYVEDIEQNLELPCFTISLLSPTQRMRSPVLYDRTMPIIIHYFTDNKSTTKNELYETAERTLDALEYLPFSGGLLRGENISWNVNEDVLQVFITYKFRTIKKDYVENMEELEVVDESVVDENSSPIT